MTRAIFILLVAQFLSAFGDNAILFVVLAMIWATKAEAAGWYIPLIQSAFLLAFVLLGPWVGRLADHWSKPRVLVWANLAKGIGTFVILALFVAEPNIVAALDLSQPTLHALVQHFILAGYAFGYGLVGAGAAIYSPAKYGILPELVSHDQLVKANAWMEGATIVAIVTGSVGGGVLADTSSAMALMVVIGLFLLSALTALLLPKIPARGVPLGSALQHFWAMIMGFLHTRRARFAMLGATLMWAAAAVLRMAIIAYASVMLAIDKSEDVALITVFLALGVVCGSIVVPFLIPLEQLHRARYAAFCMGLAVIALAFIHYASPFLNGLLPLQELIPVAGLPPVLAHAVHLLAGIWPVLGVLFLIGMAAGIFLVPINAALQEIGHKTIGAGGAIAIQNFLENVGMVCTVGLYTLAAKLGAGPSPAIAVLGVLVVIAYLLVSWHMPHGEAEDELKAIEAADHHVDEMASHH